jgi:hypothetical protein
MTEDTNRTQADIAETDALTRGDAWLFAPLLVVLVALPLAMVSVVSVSLWYAAQRLDLSLTQPAPSSFATRWPDQTLPEKTIVR